MVSYRSGASGTVKCQPGGLPSSIASVARGHRAMRRFPGRGSPAARTGPGVSAPVMITVAPASVHRFSCLPAFTGFVPGEDPAHHRIHTPGQVTAQYAQARQLSRRDYPSATGQGLTMRRPGQPVFIAARWPRQSCPPGIFICSAWAPNMLSKAGVVRVSGRTRKTYQPCRNSSATIAGVHITKTR